MTFAGGDAEAVQEGYPRKLRLVWQLAEGSPQPDHFALEVNVDGDSGFSGEGLPDDIAADATSIEIEILPHLTHWSRARYRVVALDEEGVEVASSEDIPIADVAVKQMVDRIQSPSPVAGGYAGSGMALSGDGNLLAVGVPGEQVVYLFRRGDGWEPAGEISPDDIDPSFFSSASYERFGANLDLSADGRRIVIGTPHASVEALGGGSYDGMAMVFEVDDTGESWSPLHWSYGGRMGMSVSLSTSGERYAVGGAFDDQDGWHGSVFVCDLSSDCDPSIVMGLPGSAGVSVALSGDGKTLAVGGPRGESNYTDGAVYLFEDIGDERPDFELVEQFSAQGDSVLAPGVVVALSASGNQLAFSQARDTGNTDLAVEAVLVRRTESGWSDPVTVAGTQAVPTSYGSTMALSADGRVLAICSPMHSEVAGSPVDDWVDLNNVTLYRFDETGWQGASQPHLLRAPASGVQNLFGVSMALSGDGSVLAVGAPLEDGDEEDSGAVYLY